MSVNVSRLSVVVKHSHVINDLPGVCPPVSMTAVVDFQCDVCWIQAY